MAVLTVYAVKYEGKYWNFRTFEWNSTYTITPLDNVTFDEMTAKIVVNNTKGAKLLWMSTVIEEKDNNNV